MPYGHYNGGRRQQPRRYQRSYRRGGRRSETASFWEGMAGSAWPSYSHRGRYRRQGGGVIVALILLLLFWYVIIHYWLIVIPIVILLVIGIILIFNAFRAKFNPNYQSYKSMKKPARSNKYYQPSQQEQESYEQPDQSHQYYQPSQSSQQRREQYYQPDANDALSQQPSGGHYAVPQSQYPQNPPPLQ